VPGSAVLLQAKDLLVQLSTDHCREGLGVRREAESEGPEANDEAAAEAAEAKQPMGCMRNREFSVSDQRL